VRLYFVDRQLNAIMAVHLDTKAVREVVKLPPPGGAAARTPSIAMSRSSSASRPDPDGKTTPRTPPPGGLGGNLEANWASGTPKMIYTLNIKTGEFKVIHRENDWTNHLQCSPTDPQQILFCHEGPWHYNDRTWTIPRRRRSRAPAPQSHDEHGNRRP